jgi:hypothetical protein
MTQDPEANTPEAGGQAGPRQTRGPLFSVDEAQPASAVNEHGALSEREDGTNRGRSDTVGPPSQAQPEAFPAIALTADEQQAIEATSERNALSEREDGTNRG